MHSHRDSARDDPLRYLVSEHILCPLHLAPDAASQPASHTGMQSADNKAVGQMSPSLYFLCNHVYFVCSVVFHLIQDQSSLPHYVS